MPKFDPYPNSQRSLRSRDTLGSDLDPISYEDLLIAKYLEELKKAPPYTKTDVQIEKSPYLQKLAHTHVVPTQGPGRLTSATHGGIGRGSRPTSAKPPSTTWGGWDSDRKANGQVKKKTHPSAVGQDHGGWDSDNEVGQQSHGGVLNGSRSGSKPRIDPKFIADPNLWDPASPKEGRKFRPISVPVYKRPYTCSSRPISAKSVSYTKKTRALYRQKAQTVVVTAFKNGSRDNFVRVAAPNLKLLMEACTEKLGLTSAARRAFLENGREVLDERDLRRDDTVFISSGEPFKDPEKGLKQTLDTSQKSQWTLNGLVCPEEEKKKLPKTKLSKRFQSLLEQSRRRVLVFQNGSGNHSAEIVTDPKKLADFLSACTAKLDMGSYGRILYDWDGKEVKDLEEAPVLDRCLQTAPTPVVGPLWLSKGEGFSPKGVIEFLVRLIMSTKGKLKEAKDYKKQLQMAQDEETKDKVEIVAILSMSPKEIEENIQMADKDIEDLSNALNRLKQQKDKLQDKAEEEEKSGSKFTMNHIQEYDMDHKLVGKKGIRLKIYENGSTDEPTTIYFNLHQASKGTEDANQLLCRLLDQCSSITSLAYPKKNPAIRPVAKKLFRSDGKEVKSVRELVCDDELWLSFGEAWKDPSIYRLGLQLDKVQVVELQNAEKGTERKAVREHLQTEDVKGEDTLKGGKWEVVRGLPDDAPKRVIGEKTSPEELASVRDLLSTNEISQDNYFLQNKEKPSMVLYGEVVVNTKPVKSSELWPPESQIWILSKDGYLRSKALPQMVLTMTDRKVKTRLRRPGKADDAEVEGYVVTISKKDGYNAGQQWTFMEDGYICSKGSPDHVLTYLGVRQGDEAHQVVNEETGSLPGERAFVAACAKLDHNRPAKPQRWALKQERFDNLGQWKHTEADNPEWHKRALSWPTHRDGSLNENYDWPMEGYLLPNAPPLKSSPSDKNYGDAPLRLQVMKNGMKDREKATAVVAPDLALMKKGSHTQASQGGHTGHGHGSNKHGNHGAGSHGQGGHGKSGKGVRPNRMASDVGDTESIDDFALHCDSEKTVLKLEFTMFLDRCTSLLDLPFPARRLFDANGHEHFNLCSLQRDQLVTVTCGEPWCDPKLSKAEQQRRYLLANLAADVTQIQEYVSLRNAENLVLEVEGRLASGSHLVIGEHEFLTKGNTRSVQASRDLQSEDSALARSGEEKIPGESSAHHMAHQRADQRLTRLKWPWERLYNAGEDSVDLTEESTTSQNDYQRPKRKMNSVQMELQRFLFDDGFIAMDADRSLVMTFSQEGGGQNMSVMLAKRNQDDVCQRWIIKDNGLIQTKQNPNLVLTATTKSHGDATADGNMATYVGCTVTVQRKKTVQFGRANQRWHHDQSTGFIYAFTADVHDKEITAANRGNVCTFAVMGKTEIDQIGYVVEMPEKGDGDRKILTCSSCARAMRGRYRLKKLNTNVDFACAMGSAKEFGLQQIGSFRCLNGKLDLTTFEAEHTLHHWKDELERLRKEMSVRTIAKEISTATVPYTIKVLAYKNGDGKRRPGELVIGSSISGILDQCTSRLQLTQAARRLYTADGQTVLHINDLINWVKDTCVEEEKRRLQDETKAKKQITDGTSDDLQKVKRESEDEGHEDEEGFFVGHDHLPSRKFVDDEKKVMIIPNPSSPIKADGFLTEWKIAAAKPGRISLNVLRPTNDLLTFTLAGQTQCDLVDGELVIDISSQPLPVQKGDVIGFEIKEHGMIPYEVDSNIEDPFLYLALKSDLDLGSPITLDKSINVGSRKYSLRAKIVPAVNQKVENASKNGITAKAGKKRMVARRSSKVEAPSVDAILRYPIEVFISCGEGFIKPERTNSRNEELLQNREQLAGVAYELEKEKHVLRMMQGRRMDEQKLMTFKPTLDPEQPVIVEGNWQEPTTDEVEKHNIVHHLQVHLQTMKAKQKPKGVKTSKIDTTSRLYTQPNMKRVLVFPNGEKVELAQYVWGETLDQLLDNGATRLNLSRPAKHLFTIDGELVTDFDQVERDQILCISANRKFLQPEESQQLIEIKANWARSCKAYGPNSTDIVVESPMNKKIIVDPFAKVDNANEDDD